MASSSYFIWPVLIGLLAGTDCNKLTTINRHFYYEKATVVAIAPANWLTRRLNWSHCLAAQSVLKEVFTGTDIKKEKFCLNCYDPHKKKWNTQCVSLWCVKGEDGFVQHPSHSGCFYKQTACSIFKPLERKTLNLITYSNYNSL